MQYAHHRTLTFQMPDGTLKLEGPREMMVSLDSARQYTPREQLVACHADHSQMAKLKRGQNSIYPEIRWAIKHALLTATETQATKELARLGVPFDHGRQTQNMLQGPYDDARSLRREAEVDNAAYAELLQAPGGQSLLQQQKMPAKLQSRSQSDDRINHERMLSLLKISRSSHDKRHTSGKPVVHSTSF